jgi:hypothetical protein
MMMMMMMIIIIILTEYHATRVYWGSGIIAPSILDLGTRGW